MSSGTSKHDSQKGKGGPSKGGNKMLVAKLPIVWHWECCQCGFGKNPVPEFPAVGLGGICKSKCRSPPEFNQEGWFTKGRHLPCKFCLVFDPQGKFVGLMKDKKVERALRRNLFWYHASRRPEFSQEDENTRTIAVHVRLSARFPDYKPEKPQIPPPKVQPTEQPKVQSAVVRAQTGKFQRDSSSHIQSVGQKNQGQGQSIPSFASLNLGNLQAPVETHASGQEHGQAHGSEYGRGSGRASTGQSQFSAYGHQPSANQSKFSHSGFQPSHPPVGELGMNDPIWFHKSSHDYQHQLAKGKQSERDQHSHQSYFQGTATQAAHNPPDENGPSQNTPQSQTTSHPHHPSSGSDPSHTTSSSLPSYHSHHLPASSSSSANPPSKRRKTDDKKKNNSKK